MAERPGGIKAGKEWAGVGGPARQRWEEARAALAQTSSPAAFGAWLGTLSPVALVDGGPGGAPRLVLACASTFQREHVARRYRAAIEQALGGPCELVVRAPGASAAGPGASW